ncbi:DNA repair RAD52-like protein 2, chloroplastic [Ipomoea triloba]|uniref:DNA repair RAD52-like protein 2, chloroplastic n=1 Tax=Ipomoea triloba TaxID=35885 RepID=UPI00125E154D|nr:DNA repair RAD52-like protein 2, chloroplastic [Ipomoea triloba]
MISRCSSWKLPAAEAGGPPLCLLARQGGVSFSRIATRSCPGPGSAPSRALKLRVAAVDRSSNGGAGESGASKKAAASSSSVPNSNYMVPLDKASSCITRPLAEILRDLNKRIPDNIIKDHDSDDPHAIFIPWYHANRMLSFYAPGWCGEIRNVIFSENGTVTVVYRVTILGSDGEAYRESTGTVSSDDEHIKDPVAEAEEIAFCRACARFGLGLYLYHDE